VPTAVLYARISQADRNVPAIANQTANLRTLAEREGYDVVDVLSDDGISAYSGKFRPAFMRLVDLVESGSVGVILAVAEDRLSRNDEESFILRSKSIANGVVWHTLASGVTDPGTAQGGLMARLNAALAQYESELKSERIRRSVADRLAAGKDLMGPRPFGFEPDRQTIREPEAALVRTAYQTIIGGGSVYSVAQMFTASGIPRDRASNAGWRPQTVRNILLRERNCGRLVVKGVQYADDLSRIVEPEDFETVKAILENPDRRPRRGPKPTKWAASGIVRCGVCGSYMHLTGTRDGEKRSFRCAPDSRPLDSRGKRHSTIQATALDRMISDHVGAELISLVQKGRTLSAGESRIAELRHQLAETQRQRDVAQELAFMPGANLATARAKLADLGSQIDGIQADLDAALAGDVATHALARATEVVTSWQTPEKQQQLLEGVFERSTLWDEYWSGLSLADQQALVRALLPNLVVLPQGANRIARSRIDYDGLNNRKRSA
jgi:DNA invertase Pin-like site-specific DNA recombinase